MTRTTFLIFVLVLLGFSGNCQMTPTYSDIWIPMRDNELLQADVYIPNGVDSAEVILIQTPYNKNLFRWSLPMGVGQNIDNQPYIWVIVDWRGFYGSNSANSANVNRGEDGYDVCEWIAQQTWHKSRIGTWGPSALGGVQYNTAREQHPNHTCAVPLVAHGQQAYRGYFTGGVLEKARLEQLDALGYGLSPIVLANPYYSPLWQYTENTTWFAPDLHIPTLQIGGWYDHNIDIMVDFYEAARTSADVSVRDQQWFLIGPWVHGGTGSAYVGSSAQGELSYPNAALKSDSMAWDFLNYYLLDTPNNWQNTPLITYYELGKNTWASSNATHIEEQNTDILYLDGGSLTSAVGSGNSTFISDPKNSSPTLGGATLHSSLDQGPYDQSALDSRSDILTFTSETLTGDVSISGRVRVNVFVESDQPDGDIAIRLADVYPTGESMLITDGIQRIRFRNGYTQADEVFMTPGNSYSVAIDLPFVNYTWLAGHRIKLYVGGNNAYRYDVNLQNGGTMYAAGDTNSANMTIHHDFSRPSHILLPGNNAILGKVEVQPARVEIYPNPASETLSVSTDHPFSRYTISDLHGRIVQEGNNMKSIEVAYLKNGMYILRLYSDDHTSEQRFIKN